MWWLVKHLPPESALARAEAVAAEPAASWTLTEHLLARTAGYLGELTYVTTLVHTEESKRRQVFRPEWITHPAHQQEPERRHPRHRQRVGPPLDPREFGGAPMDTTAVEVE